MNCQQFDKLIVNLVCGQLADAAKRRNAMAHAQSCVYCGTRLARQQTVAEGLRALAVQERTLNAPAHLGAALQAAFERRQKLAVPENCSPQPTRVDLFSLLNWRWAAAMVSMLIVAGLIAALWRQPVRQISPKQTEIAATMTPPPVETPENNETKLAAKLPPKPKRKKPARRGFNEYGALISLMPIAQTEAEEFQQVVRMQIPRSTLRLWGLPLNEEGGSEQIRAEVFFSEDGVARAIRLQN